MSNPSLVEGYFSIGENQIFLAGVVVFFFFIGGVGVGCGFVLFCVQCECATMIYLMGALDTFSSIFFLSFGHCTMLDRLWRSNPGLSSKRTWLER